MKLTSNRILVLTGVLSSIALVVGVLLRYKSVPRLQFEALEKSNPPLAEKITTSRTQVAGETTAESLEKLSDINSFFWPGPQEVGGMVVVQNLLPLAASKGRRDVDAIVSNRRARKVFADLGSDSKPAGVKLFL